MKKVSAREIQEIDKLVIERIGIPSLVLMENAGRQTAEKILGQLRRPLKSKVSVFCGLGNNAGDGFVIARYLMNAGVRVRVFLIGKRHQLKSDAAVQCNILRNLKCPVQEIQSSNLSVCREIASSDLLVDAIFGVGLNREISEPFRSVIKSLNGSGKRIIAVDVPSGLDATTGSIHGVCVRAHMTVTFSYAKKGFFIKNGPIYIGKLAVVDIGIPRAAVRKLIKH